jgi:hypothetical protein
MNEYLLEAREELKRLEHIIYVSLKYTRTVDVIINALNRMVGTCDTIIESFLQKAKEEGKIAALPKSPALRATKLADLYPEDRELQKYLHFYYFLKNILKLPHRKREEFRRHVAFVVEIEQSTAEINIDNLLNCEKFLHQFFTYSWHTLVGKPEDEY